MSPQKKKLEAAIDSLFSTPKLHPKKENHTTVSASAHAEPTSVPVSGDAVALVPPPTAVVEEPVVEPVKAAVFAVAEAPAAEIAPVNVAPSPAPEPIRTAAPAPVAPAPVAPAAPKPVAAAPTAPVAVTPAAAAPAAAKNAAVSLGLGATNEQQEDCRGDFQSVVFTLDNQYYGLSISAVESIIKLQAITELPHARHSIIGVTNLRGKVMPVIDLRQRFGLGSKEATKNSRIIVVNFDQIEAGLLVDGVSEVLTVDKCDIEEAPAMISMGNISACFIKGIAKVDDRLVILLDLKEVLYLEK